MKTLYININGEEIQTTDTIVVVGKPEDAIINKFYFELGKQILKGVVAPGISSIKKKDIVTDFKSHDEVAFGKILDQWECVKSILLGENPTGTYKINLPTEYLGWLQNNSQSIYAEIAKSLYQRGCVVEISIDKKDIEKFYYASRLVTERLNAYTHAHKNSKTEHEIALMTMLDLALLSIRKESNKDHEYLGVYTYTRNHPLVHHSRISSLCRFFCYHLPFL